ncbi:hypothetical protein [Pseudophaeobacter sp.]|uniref:hypothetical protein n=1 Tax=Pseudophaeobacter sp. TaxID=1971739 RepID=UPI003263D864
MNERENLLARAKELEISHPGNIGDEKLKAKIAEVEAKAGADAKAKADADVKAKADADAKAKADADAKPVDMVIIKGPERGRWRIGRKFTREATEIPREDLSDGQLEALKGDPELIVSFS